MEKTVALKNGKSVIVSIKLKMVKNLISKRPRLNVFLFAIVFKGIKLYCAFCRLSSHNFYPVLMRINLIKTCFN